MINKKAKREKGVTLIALIVTVVMILILTGVFAYNVKDSLKIERLKLMQNDITNLKDKVSAYYAKNGKIPANIKYTQIGKIQNAGVISEAVDTGEFYVIDLSALEGITLNYGKDYEKIKENPEEVNNYEDLYIINEASHNIFYVNGIVQDEETLYTDYTEKGVDIKGIDLRYIEGIKIPNGYTYVKGSKETQIIIKNNEDKTKEYKWIAINSKIEEIPEEVQIEVSEEKNFIKSVNAYKGYYKSTQEGSKEVVYIELENWSKTYEEEYGYKDKNGDTAYIPEGFQVSQVPGENTIQEGLVIKNEQTNDRYVWIEVPKTIYKLATAKEEYENIENDLKEYAKAYQDSNYTDTWNENCGIETQEEYENLKNDMLSSIYEKGGFWIGQYEAGINEQKTSGLASETIESLIQTNGIPMSQEGKYPYNYVTCSQAQKLSQKLSEGKSYKTSLMFGIQWDLVCKFEQTNIYDLAGNVSEWTLEANNTQSDVSVCRGGNNFVSQRESLDQITDNIGFRIAIF